MKKIRKKRLKLWLNKRKFRKNVIEHHDGLWKLGEYYNSDYVKLNMPWIRMIPFWEFVERQMGREGERGA
jgi:hypothetical protein